MTDTPKAGDGWRENAAYLLDNCPHTIRVRDTEHPDELLTSLVVTFQKMQRMLEGSSARQLERENAELRRDAERYRFLRNPWHAIVYAKDHDAWGSGQSGHVRYDTPEQLDAAIDVALQKVTP
jgi:hypothetical protein